MNLVERPFDVTFAFARGRQAQHRDATGELVRATRNAPRFDHDEAGAPRGLLIEGRPESWTPDRLRVRAGDWATGPGTVLHAMEAPDGALRFTAWYCVHDPVAAVNACLRLKGRHRLIAYVPGFLKNRDGAVYWRRQLYALGGVLETEPGVILATTNERLVLEGG